MWKKLRITLLVIIFLLVSSYFCLLVGMNRSSETEQEESTGQEVPAQPPKEYKESADFTSTEDVDFTTEEYLPGYDDNQYSIQPLSGVVETDKGFYYKEGSLLVFHDKESGQTVPLCSQPNCTHSGEGCDAYFFDGGTFLWHYNGYLYTMNGQRSLVQISEDGSTRAKAGTLTSTVSGDASYMLIFHRGYIYYAYHSEYLGEQTSTLYRRKLQAGAKDEKVYEITGYGAQIYRIRARGNDLYFQGGTFADSEGNEMVADIYRCTLDGLKVEKVASSVLWSYCLGNDGLYYSKDDQLFYLKKGGKNPQKLLDIPKSAEFACDGNALYIDNYWGLRLNRTEGDEHTYDKREILVVSLDGELLHRISYPYDGEGVYCKSAVVADYYENGEHVGKAVCSKKEMLSGKYDFEVWKQ